MTTTTASLPPTSFLPESERERRGDVVAVADVRDPQPFEPAEVLAQRQQVGERLARVRAVGEQVDDRDVDRPRPCARACGGRTRGRDHRAHRRPSCARRPRPTRACRARPLRRARRSGDRRASRPPSRSRCGCAADGFSNSAATPRPASTGGIRAGSAFHATARSRIRARAGPDRGRRPRGTTAHALRAAPRRTRRRRSRPRRRSRRRSRAATARAAARSAVTAFTTSPPSRHPARPPWRRARARARPRSAGRRRARRRRRRPSAAPPTSRAPARAAALGNVSRSMTVERRERGACRERLAAEGRGVITGRERGRDIGPRPARADRHAVAERLGHRDDVGRDARVLEPEPPTGATEPALHLVDDQQRFALVAQPPHAVQVLGRRRARRRPRPAPASSITAATRSSIAAASASRSSNATCRKPVGQRLERLLLLRLAGRGERGERAPVERAVRADHVEAVGAAVAAARGGGRA